MAPEPPFLKAVTFTLMGVPKVQAGCVPMIQHGVNILNLPLISNFVNWAIKTACNMYVAPKSMTLDLGKMLQGDDIQKETNALGVVFIRIHKAVGLSKQDARGSKGGGSDPYVTVSWSKFGKPMYCTRVIQDDLNPVFEETCALMVTADLIKANEQLSMELWDSDRSSADDVVGKVELSMQKLIQHPGKMYTQVSKLRGVKADSEMPGELHWEVGFFGKTQFRSALRTDGKTSKACWAPGSSAYTTVAPETSRSRATNNRACSTSTNVSWPPCSTKKSGASLPTRSSGVPASKTSGASAHRCLTTYGARNVSRISSALRSPVEPEKS